MNEPEWDNGTDDPWEVPLYLHNIYAVWTLVGDALQAVVSAHHGSHVASAGYDHPRTGEEMPPDTLIGPLMDRPIDDAELEKREAGEEYISVHHTLQMAVASIQATIEGIVYHIKDLGALPPWWQAEFDALTNMPQTWEDDDGA
jgi:hypothetical protein